MSESQVFPSTPATTAATTATTAERVLAPTYQRPAEVYVRGAGAWLETAAGERHLDMTSGIAVNVLGHGSPLLQRWITEAAHGLIHTSNLFHTEAPTQLAEALVARSFAETVFFANSGAEANEGAIKFARLAGGSDRREIVSFTGAFHGRTLATLAAGEREDHRAPFTPVPAGFRRAPFGSMECLEAIGPQTAGVLVEPIQGESGIHVADSGWLQALRARCDETGALLIFDEVQCGLGRTGSLWAYQQTGVEPDLMALAKPLAGGLPMGAVLLGARASAAVRPGVHGTTFGGGPFVAAIASKVLAHVDRPDFLAGVRERGAHLHQALSALAHPQIRALRGRGLMLGLEVEDSAALVAAARQQGLLLVGAGGQTVRFLPPLNVPFADLDEAVRRLTCALEATSNV